MFIWSLREDYSVRTLSVEIAGINKGWTWCTQTKKVTTVIAFFQAFWLLTFNLKWTAELSKWTSFILLLWVLCNTVFENPQKKSYSKFRAKRAKFTFWVGKSSLKMPKKGQFWRLFEKFKCDIFSNFQTLWW